MRDEGCEFYRNPGQTLYGYVQYYYPQVRSLVFKQQDLPAMYFFEHLHPTEQALLLQYEKDLPSVNQLTDKLTNDEVNLLLWIVEGYHQHHRVARLETYLTISRLKSFFDFLKNQHHPMTGIMSHILSRSYAPEAETYLAAYRSSSWGYWTPQECQQVLPFLQGLIQRDHPEYLTLEHHIKAQSEDIRKNFSRIEKIEQLRSNFCSLQDSFRCMIEALTSLHPEEGLVAYFY